MSAAGRKFRQALSVTGDQHIRGGFALGDGSDGKPLGDVRRHVLHAVDGYVHAPVPQGLLDLLDEETLAAHLGERHVEDLVALGLDDRELDGHPGEARQQRRADPLGLPQRKLAAPGPDGDRLGHQCLHPPQLDAWQPPQEEPAACLTV